MYAFSFNPWRETKQNHRMQGKEKASGIIWLEPHSASGGQCNGKIKGVAQAEARNSTQAPCLASALPLKRQRRPIFYSSTQISFSLPPWEWACCPWREQNVTLVFCNLRELQASLRRRRKTTPRGHTYGAGNIWIPLQCPWCLCVYGLKGQLIESEFSWPLLKEEHSCTGHSTIPRSNQAWGQLLEKHQPWELTPHHPTLG